MKELTNVIDTVNKIFRVAIYIRLSKEDVKKDKNGNEIIEYSESVENQRYLLLKWVKDNGHNLIDVYIDDDYTGQNYDRPSFKRMMEDIDLGKIDMVVTKDLSRLGRDYIETGAYVEKIFPKKNIRYVAINDSVDTFIDSASNDIAPFKLIINDMYSRDNSKKIKTALRSRMDQGLWVGGCPPFGYKVVESNKNQLIINDDEAPIVKKIFNLALKGNSRSKIIQVLFEEKIPTPSMIRRIKRKNKYADVGYWNTTTIKTILTNNLYTGDLVQNRRSRISYKVRNVVENDKSEWIITPNAHEAIIEKDIFKEVQRIIKNSTGIWTNKKSIKGLLDGLIYCGECKKRLGLQGGNGGNNNGHYYTYCYTYRKYSKLNLCTSHCVNYGKLEKAILNQLKVILDKFIDKNQTNNNLLKNKDNIKNTNNLTLTLKKIEQDLTAKKELLDKMYLDKLESKIAEDMYNRIYQKMTIEIKELEDKKKIISSDIFKNNLSNNDNECMKLIKEFFDIKIPSRDVIFRLIKRIELHQDKTIDIYFNFKKLNTTKSK